MRFSAEQFGSLIQAALQHSGERQHEARRSPRINHHVPVVMVLGQRKESELPEVVQLRDLSAGGISFIRPTKMRKGEQFLLRLPRQDKGFLFLLYSVVGCRAMRDGLCCVHAEFICTISDVTGTPVKTDFSALDRIRSAVLD